MSDDWDEAEAPVKEVPKILKTCRVKEDFFPEKHTDLTLLRDELVYVFKLSSDRPGWWEGETRGQYGPFPSEFVTEVKP